MKSTGSINIYRLMFLLAGSVILLCLPACDEKDDYDFSQIEPVILSMTGPGLVAAHGLTDFPYVYTVPHRGGSSFNWSVTSKLGGSATIEQDDTYPGIAYITFDQSSVQDTAIISVTETTMGGKTSPPFTKKVALTPFCPEDMAPWAGIWSSDNSLDHDELVAAIPQNTLNTLVIDGLAGALVEIYWEENWIPNVGGQGKTTITFDCGDVIVLEEQLLGETYEWGEYWISGEGTYDPQNMIMYITYNIAWSKGGSIWDTFDITLTGDGTKSARVMMMNIPEK